MFHGAHEYAPRTHRKVVLQPSLSTPLAGLSGSLICSSRQRVFTVRYGRPRACRVCFAAISIQCTHRFICQRRLQLIKGQRKQHHRQQQVPTTTNCNRHRRRQAKREQRQRRDPLQQDQRLTTFTTTHEQGVHKSSRSSTRPILCQQTTQQASQAGRRIQHRGRHHNKPTL